MLCLVREKQVFMISEGDAHKRRAQETRSRTPAKLKIWMPMPRGQGKYVERETQETWQMKALYLS